MAAAPTLTLTLRDFRCFERVDWSPHGVCLLAGPNGSGKTSLIDALEFLRNHYGAGAAEALRLAGGGAHPRRVGAKSGALASLGFAVENLTWTVSIPAAGQGIDARHGEVLTIDGKAKMRREPMDSPVLFVVSDKRANYESQRDGLRLFWDMAREEAAPFEPLIDRLSSMQFYKRFNLDAVRAPQSESKQRNDALHPTGENLWIVLRNWRASPIRHPGVFDWVMSAVRDAFPDLVRDLDFESLGQSVFARLYPPGARSADDGLPIDCAPDGLLTGLLQLTAVAGAPQGALLAFDEMENHLHPHAIRSILRSIRERADERDLTVILTTHSPVLMNEFKGHEDQFFILEPGHPSLPIALDQAKDPAWLAHFALGDLFEREEFAAPDTHKPAAE